MADSRSYLSFQELLHCLQHLLSFATADARRPFPFFSFPFFLALLYYISRMNAGVSIVKHVFVCWCIYVLSCKTGRIHSHRILTSVNDRGRLVKVGKCDFRSHFSSSSAVEPSRAEPSWNTYIHNSVSGLLPCLLLPSPFASQAKPKTHHKRRTGIAASLSRT